MSEYGWSYILPSLLTVREGEGGGREGGRDGEERERGEGGRQGTLYTFTPKIPSNIGTLFYIPHLTTVVSPHPL